ncbi:MAG TPA: IS21 family transposase [Bacillota bacterium]|nr:IS21 family transposase [Bacillota bacterium]
MRDIVEIYRHWQAGRGFRCIAQSLGVDRKTIRKYIRAAVAAGFRQDGQNTPEEWKLFVKERFPEIVDQAARSSCFGELDKYRDYIAEGLATNCMSTVWQRLREATGVNVSASPCSRYVRATMPDALVVPNEVTVYRPEVPPGEEVQIDFAYLGRWGDPRTGSCHRLWAFIMVLSFSRHIFVRPVMRMDKRSWLECNVGGLEFFQGVPRRLVLDNLTDGVLKPDIYEPQLNRAYEELAAHYGVLIDPCRRGKPKDKPRVERAVSYVRDSFFRGRTFSSFAEIEQEALRWCVDVAGMRIHGTTGQRPLEAYNLIEKATLKPLPERWEFAVWQTAKVGPDSHCAVRRVLYSVPWRYIGQELQVRVSENRVQFYLGDELVKTHICMPGERRQTDAVDLPPDKIAFFQRTPQWCMRQAKQMGESAFELVLELLREKTLTHLRQAQGVIRLCDTYGAERLNRACARALSFGDVRYRTVKGILSCGLDGQPTPEGTCCNAGALLHGIDAFAKEDDIYGRGESNADS